MTSRNRPSDRLADVDLPDNRARSLGWLLDYACRAPRDRRHEYVALLEQVATRQSDLVCRVRASWPAHLSIAQIDLATQIDLLREFPNAFGLAVACSLSPSGYVREPAVRNLAAMRDDRSLPILMMRSVDWVTPISMLAEQSVEDLLPSAPDSALYAGVPAYLALRRYESPRTGRVQQMFAAEVSRRPELVLQMRRSRRDPVQRFLFASGVSASSETPKTRVSDALWSKAPTALKAVRSLILDSQEARQSMASELVANPVATAALIGVEAAESEGRTDLLWEAAFHRNWRVRATARFYLKSRGDQDFQQWYASRLPEPSAVLGLAEVALGDAPLSALLPLLHHSDPRVRAAAASALGSRGFNPSVPILIEMLQDPKTKVVREVVAALSKLPVSLSLEQALAAMNDHQTSAAGRHARQKALGLVPFWDSISLLLILARHGTLESIEGAFQRWFNGLRNPRLAAPRRDQIERALVELHDSREILVPDLVGKVRCALEDWWRKAN